MVSISVKVTLPKRKYGNMKWLDEMASEQRRSAEGKLKHLFEQTVFGWSNKPTFGWSQVRTSEELTLTMYPKGAYAHIWTLVNAGSPPHPINAKPGGILAFRPGYRASTTPGSLMSRRNYRSGKFQFAQQIPMHPGFAPRAFTEQIADEYHSTFSADMQHAIHVIANK